MTRNVIILTRGSKEEGWGHIIRGVRLQEHLKKKKKKSKLFIECDRFVRNKIKKLEYDYHQLFSIGLDIKLNFSSNDLIIIDRYSYSFEFVKKFFKAKKVVIFDELKRINFENKLRKEDVIIRSQLTEKIKSNKFNCRILEGIKYFAFDSYLKEEEQSIDLLIMLGGGNDCLNIYDSMFTEFRNYHLSNLKILLVTGSENYRINKNIKKEFPFLEVRGFVENTLDLMNKSKLAVLSGGYCKYEANYFKLPSILISMKNHQIDISKKYCKETNNIYVGSVKHKLILKKITMQIFNFFNKKEIFQPKRIIDGKGMDRILSQVI